MLGALKTATWEEKYYSFGKWHKVRTYNIDESRKKDDDDGGDAHQGAVQSGLDYPFRKSLQGDREELQA